MKRPDPRFLEGLELFNKGEYYECHEVIEELWLETPPNDLHRDLYKGVIQAAAAIYQYQRGIWSGAIGLCRTSVEYLEKYGAEALGLDVQGLAGEMRLYFAGLLEWKGAADTVPPPPKRVPRVVYEPQTPSQKP